MLHTLFLVLNWNLRLESAKSKFIVLRSSDKSVITVSKRA